MAVAAVDYLPWCAGNSHRALARAVLYWLALFSSAIELKLVPMLIVFSVIASAAVTCGNASLGRTVSVRNADVRLVCEPV